MSNQFQYEKIESYLNGTLSGSELADFEQQIKSNQDLAAQVALFEEMDMALSDETALDFQKMVQAEDEAFFEENEQEKPPEKPIIRQLNSSRKLWMIAASFLVFVFSVFILWQFQSNEPTSNKELFAQYYETYSLNENLRGNNTNPTNFQKGVQQYQAKDFDSAAQTFESLLVVNKQDMSLTFCLANAYMNQNPPQFNLAEQQFQKIISNNSSIYVPKSKWYKALILLQKEKSEDVKTLLKEVSGSGDKFGKKAKELLENLEKK